MESKAPSFGERVAKWIADGKSHTTKIRQAALLYAVRYGTEAGFIPFNAHMQAWGIPDELWKPLYEKVAGQQDKRKHPLTLATLSFVLRYELRQAIPQAELDQLKLTHSELAYVFKTIRVLYGKNKHPNKLDIGVGIPYSYFLGKGYAAKKNRNLPKAPANVAAMPGPDAFLAGYRQAMLDMAQQNKRKRQHDYLERYHKATGYKLYDEKLTKIIRLLVQAQFLALAPCKSGNLKQGVKYFKLGAACKAFSMKGGGK